MKLEQLRVFLSVLEHRSFSRAADDIGLSQSTVSFHVAALEEVTAARLLDRVRGDVRATEQGMLLERYARRIVAMSDEAVVRLQQREATPSGHLVVAASTIVAEHLLAPALHAFRQACPAVRVTVQVSDSRQALDALRHDSCELALIGAPADDRRFESLEFAHDDIVLVGPPTGVRVLDCAASLAELPLVLRELGSGTRSAVADFLAEADLERADIVTVGSTQAARRMVLAGLGYSFISRRAIDEDVRGRRLRIVKFAGTPLERSFHLVKLRSHTPTAAAKALQAVVLESTA